MSKKNSAIEELTKVITNQENKVNEFSKLLSTIYLNHINDNSVHGTSLKLEIESLAKKYGGDLLFDINLYKG